MNIKISKIDSIAGDFDINGIVTALEQDSLDDLSPKELQEKAFKDDGSIPNKVAALDAKAFGLRKSYFDVWTPVNEATPGIWKLNKEADGTEWITREEDGTDVKFS
jgi:hypothetical protein